MTKATLIRPAQRARTTGRKPGAGWLAFLFATLFAFTAQSVVLGTHQHLDPGTAVSAATTTAAKAAPDNNAPVDSPANCPICREMAFSGAYLASAPIVLHAPQPFDGWQVATIVSWPRIAQPPLGWRSRAPPFQTQA